jgi:hypothetical protein
MLPPASGGAVRVSLVALVCLFGALAPCAEARQTVKKSIWGPVRVNGVSQFPIYQDLGVGLYQATLVWPGAAPVRPSTPADPRDAAYRWPPELDDALREAQRHGMRVSLLVHGAPLWVNGGRHRRWAPTDPADLADFVTAASRRYPGVRHWMIWGEPSRRQNFQPLVHERRDRPLTRRMRRGPRTYARLLDAAYAALKRVNRRNLVIGGNTLVTGDVSPYNWIKNLRLPNGRAPRMDMYGHNPFGARRPDLRKRALGHGFADFSSLDTLAGWVDRYLRRPRGRKLRLFLSEYSVATDHIGYESNFYVTRAAAARFVRSALRITRRWRRIYTFGWIGLYDEAPRPTGDEMNRGLLDYLGRKKPAYEAYKRG